MLDSSAKIPSGLLRGNVNQLGDYDQCLGVLAHVKVDERTIRIQGKYCLATVDLHASHPDMKLPVNLMQGRAFVRSNMQDVRGCAPSFRGGKQVTASGTFPRLRAFIYLGECTSVWLSAWR